MKNFIVVKYEVCNVRIGFVAWCLSGEVHLKREITIFFFVSKNLAIVRDFEISHVNHCCNYTSSEPLSIIL